MLMNAQSIKYIIYLLCLKYISYLAHLAIILLLLMYNHRPNAFCKMSIYPTD